MSVGNFRVPLAVASSTGASFRPLEALVDTGATYTCVPREVLEELGITPEEAWPFVLADGRETTYPIATIRVRLGQRTRHTIAVFGERGTEALIGAVTLEEFGLAVDPLHRRLIPIPGLLKASV
jgi:clan AA aspartic protease